MASGMKWSPFTYFSLGMFLGSLVCGIGTAHLVDALWVAKCIDADAGNICENDGLFHFWAEEEFWINYRDNSTGVIKAMHADSLLDRDRDR